MAGNPSHDLVLFGATGFTGVLVADYLAAHAPEGTRWALAGRDRGRLEAVRDRVAKPGRPEVQVLVADVTDAASVRTVAESARVVITTVGPYLTYGEPLVAACAEAGTDYVDLTGEPEFVDLVYLRHHRRAVETGARLVHSCGFDSIPHDLGAYFTVRELPEDVPIQIEGFVRMDADISGGTWHSALTAFSRAGQMWQTHRRRLEAEPPLKGRRVRSAPGSPRPHAGLNTWALPFPTIDYDVIRRSAAALDRYGPDFTYRHHFAAGSLPAALGLTAGAGLLAVLSQITPIRERLGAFRKPGQGPGPERRARSSFSVHFHGMGGGRHVITKVSGGDPGYDETAKMLAESALCLAFDDLPATSGQVTTAAAMGDALITRLTRAGLPFEVLATEPAG